MTDFIEEKKHNYFYRITNQINWKFYYGIRSCKVDPEKDIRYFGSGKLIHEAIKKYGKENFVKTIISDYPTRKEASDHEKLAVTQIQVEDPMCYNLMTGGDNERVHSIEWRESHSKKVSGSGNGMFGKTHSLEAKKKIGETSLNRIFSDEAKEKMRISRLDFLESSEGELFRIYQSEQYTGEGNPFFGKTHSEESKLKMSESSKGYQPRLGSKLSDETKNKISIAHKLYQSLKPEITLPDGVFYCNEIIDGKFKKCFRFCPICDQKLFHGGRADAVRAFNKNSPCFSCAMKMRSKTSNQPLEGEIGL